MLLRHRTPGIESAPVQPRDGLEHLDQKSLAVLRWLNANKVDYVVVGPVAKAIRGDLQATGPVAIVPAPYGRNFERLSSALVGAHAKLRVDTGTGGGARGMGGARSKGGTYGGTGGMRGAHGTGGTSGDSDTVTIKLNAEKLARGPRWTFRCGVYDLDIEGRGAGGTSGPAAAPRYQELLYEAGRFDLAVGLSVEAASLEDLEHYAHLRRTGAAPQIRISRKAKAQRSTV